MVGGASKIMKHIIAIALVVLVLIWVAIRREDEKENYKEAGLLVRPQGLVLGRSRRRRK